MKQNIHSLIANYEWAGIDSITFNDGRMVLLDIEFFAKENYYIGPIADSTIDSYLKYNSDDLSSFDVFSKVKYGDYEVFVGDGSSEGNGVIYVTNVEVDSLVWFAFFENSEPFKEVSVDENGVIHALSAVNITWKLSLDNPLSIELIFPEIARMPE
ncbi:MAG: hypothetical protein HRT58_22135 [Crocinitomicaceae bacterium]|nr:hypothetical protein [Flavobacteriales bacterium]NQZ38376.1 hypothetical protein [Crocinitomicaceae bacterium]